MATVFRRSGKEFNKNWHITQGDFDVIVKCESHTDEIIAALGEAVGRAAKAIGLQAESYAKENETRVDTGRLRNSITNYVESEKDIYIGTNVEYAPYHELGTSTGIPALHFLKNAAEGHTDEYKGILESSLKNN